MRMTVALLAYRQRCVLRGDNAQLFAAPNSAYRAGQHMTPATREMITQSVSAGCDMKRPRMRFMQVDYAQSRVVVANLLDANSPRVNRARSW